MVTNWRWHLKTTIFIIGKMFNAIITEIVIKGVILLLEVSESICNKSDMVSFLFLPALIHEPITMHVSAAFWRLTTWIPTLPETSESASGHE